MLSSIRRLQDKIKLRLSSSNSLQKIAADGQTVSAKQAGSIFDKQYSFIALYYIPQIVTSRNHKKKSTVNY